VHYYFYHCREDLDRQTELTEKYFSKMKDLKIMLESSRARVKVSVIVIS
jgi:hypothetical protein